MIKTRLTGAEFEKLKQNRDAVFDAAQKRYVSLSPEQRRKHDEAQQKSWVIGEMMLAHPNMTRVEAEKLYEQVVLALGSPDEQG